MQFGNGQDEAVNNGPSVILIPKMIKTPLGFRVSPLRFPAGPPPRRAADPPGTIETSARLDGVSA
jgi:hypothetical protein